MTALMRADHAPPEVLRILADLFAKRVGPVMGVAAGPSEVHAQAMAASTIATSAAQRQQQQWQL